MTRQLVNERCHYHPELGPKIKSKIRKPFLIIRIEIFICSFKIRLENGWNSKRMIIEGDAAIPLETTRRAVGNQEKSKQRSAII